jgi:predicted helicase
VYEEFENICFVDTLDNTLFVGKQMDLFAMTVENTARIKRQNDRTISVIIGNPPYNANQQNENDNNKNREYPAIDKLIQASYVKHSTAQKTKAYDMYTRFIRWASDRLGNNGIIAFITNSSFLDGRAFDGFRKSVSDDFNYIYVIDLHGDVRKNPKLSGTTHNVFGIQTGVAIMLMVKKPDTDFNRCQIFYLRRPEFETAGEKLEFLSNTKFNQIPFEHITPDKKYNWINQTDNDFDGLLPVVDKGVKAGKGQEAVFKLFSLGVATNRDEWVYDFEESNLRAKINFFCNVYEKEKQRWKNSDKNTNINDFVDRSIKWTAELEEHLKKGSKLKFNSESITLSIYRPFIKQYFYIGKHLIHRLYQTQSFFPKLKDNLVICLTVHKQVPFVVQATNCFYDGGLGSRGTHGVALYTYDQEGNRIDNITDWGLEQIHTHYQDTTITKIDIFHYTYGVLHNPEYRQKYELNLKRDFPRLPLYDNFPQWVDWGKQLMDLHINYETVTPYKLSRVDIPLKGNQAKPKPKLKADKTKGSIILDDVTTLQGVPSIAWEYMLGNRCALEWILDQYKEKKPKDPTIAEKFNTYRFADYKEQVIDLLMRVCRVSVETMNIVNQMSDS